MNGKATIKFESIQRIYFEVKTGIATPALRQSLYASATEDPFFEHKTADELGVSIDFAATEDPLFEHETAFGDLLDLAIKGNTVFNGTIRPEDRKYLLDGFEALQKIINEKKNQVEAIPNFGVVKQLKFKP